MKRYGTERGFRKRGDQSSSWERNQCSLMSTRPSMEFRIDLHQMIGYSLGVVSRSVRLPRLLLTNTYSPAFLIPQPLSVTLKTPVSPSSQVPVVQTPASVESPPSLLFRLLPQLRPPPRVATTDTPARPLDSRQQPHHTTLTVSVMIAMPTPPTIKPQNSSVDTFPPVQVGVTRLQTPQGWSMDPKSESS